MDGSDLMNQGDYFAVYVIIETDAGLKGHGLNGRGNEPGTATAAI
jgi:hypothetical protein